MSETGAEPIDEAELLLDVAVSNVAPEQLTGALEAILFVVEAPVTVTALATAVQQPTGAVKQALDALRTSVHSQGIGECHNRADDRCVAVRRTR